MTLLELAERCERAEGPDRELDCLIGVAIGRFFTQPNKGWPDRPDYCEHRRDDTTCFPGNGFDQLVPRYTASLDAAMTLVPEGYRFSVDNAFGDGGAVCGAVVNNAVFAKNAKIGDAATPALALAAAACRARHAMETKDVG